VPSPPQWRAFSAAVRRGQARRAGGGDLFLSYSSVIHHAQDAKPSKIRVTAEQACLETTGQQARAEAEPTTERRSRGCVQAATRYLSWHELLKRVYDLDSMLCPRCGGRLKFISVIMDQAVARKILKSLGLPCDPPVVARARAPTLFDDEPPPPDNDAA
jgi:hypothetical protein